MLFKLHRNYAGTDCTLGTLTVTDIDGRNVLAAQCIERPWVPSPQYKGGTKGISCVPPGVYRLECHSSEAHPRTWALVNKDLGVTHWPTEADEGDRTVVLIHTANYASELRGCIAPGLKSYVDEVRGSRMVTNSRQAMKLIQDHVPWTDDHSLEIL